MRAINLKLTAIVGALLLLGAFVLLYQRNSNIKSINNFEECVSAGYPIMESYPERCQTPDGRTFTRQVSETDTWIPQEFDEAGLSLSLKIPPDTSFRKEIADDAGRTRVASFYIEKGSPDNPTYQLYAVYQPLEDATEQDIERVETGMDPQSVAEVSIDGYEGIEGLTVASGPKNHYSMAIIKDGKLFTVSTWPPIQENKELTDKILVTFDFK